MPRRIPSQWITMILLSVIVTLIIALVVLIPQFVSFVRASSGPVSSTALVEKQSVNETSPSPALVRARALLARVRDEIVPRDGQATNYGMTFSDAGYQTLMRWNKDFKVEALYANAFESLDLHMPCCDWRTPSRNEEKNCACGHHQALEGLSKKLLSDDWKSDSVQHQVTLWTRYLFPKETVRAEMEKRAQLDPEMKAALDELNARGEC